MDWKDKVKTAAFSVQVIFCFSVLMFCFLQIGLARINEQDKVWYFSTITFIVGLVVNKGSSSRSESAKQPTITGSGLSSPSGFNNAPTTPEHIVEVK